MAITFIAVVVGWVMFKADRLSTAIAMYQTMFGLFGAHGSFEPDAQAWFKLGGALICIWVLPNSYQIFARYRPALGPVEPVYWRFLNWRPTLIWALVSASCIAAPMLPLRPVLSFLYFQF